MHLGYRNCYHDLGHRYVARVKGPSVEIGRPRQETVWERRAETVRKPVIERMNAFRFRVYAHLLAPLSVARFPSGPWLLGFVFASVLRACLALQGRRSGIKGVDKGGGNGGTRHARETCKCCGHTGPARAGIFYNYDRTALRGYLSGSKKCLPTLYSGPTQHGVSGALCDG